MVLDFTLEQLPVAADGKNNRSGKAAILRPEQLRELFDELGMGRDKFLFGICYFTASRITETLKLKQEDIVGNTITFGRHSQGRLTRQGADWILRRACDRLGIKGVSTHSFRRSFGAWRSQSFVTQMIAEGKTPAQIQRYTGHKSLGSLLHYIGA